MFDLQIKFLVELRRGGGDPTPEPGAETLGVPIFTALQQQLGLKLESGKAPVSVLVIESRGETHAELRDYRLKAVEFHSDRKSVLRLKPPEGSRLRAGSKLGKLSRHGDLNP